MPIWLRRLTHKLIGEWKRQENEAIKNAQKSSSSTSTEIGSKDVPAHIKNMMKEASSPNSKKPSYTTKPSKK